LSTRIADLHAVVRYFDPGSVTLFGSGFGGNVVFHSAVGDGGSGAVKNFVAVAARAPVTYAEPFEKYRPDGAASTDSGAGGVGEGFFDDFDGYGFEAVEQNIDVPVAVFHG